MNIFFRALSVCFFCGVAGLVCAQESTDMRQRFKELMFADKKQAQLLVSGHSHNDYAQEIPFFTAYYAGMESIEVDLFLQDDTLYVAHEKHEILQGRTFEALYLKPLAQKFKSNKNQPFEDPAKPLQLLLDFKEDHRKLMPALLPLLERYRFMLTKDQTYQPVRVVISGNVPDPKDFNKFPDWILFDGRPDVNYNEEQRQRLGMISQNLRAYSDWNGKGVPTKLEMECIQKDSQRAKNWGITFRLWGTPESVNTWIVLEKMGVSWLNTDKPAVLKAYLDDLSSSRFQGTADYPIYQPTYASDGASTPVRNVIMLIGDGMGLGHIQTAIVANGGKANMSNLRHLGFSFTSSYSPGNTDSGAAGTALATGTKTFNGALGVDTLEQPLSAIPKLIAPFGMHSAIISTGDASDATPAAFYANNKDRNASESISASLIHNTSIDILAATKPRVFQNPEKWNAFTAGVQGNGFELLEDKKVFENSQAQRLLLYLPDSVMRPVKDGRSPVLSELLTTTIQKLKNRGQGFFIMAEGAQIDYAGHARDLAYVATETLDFDQAVGEALRFADEDGHTLVLVLADHETGALTLLDVDQKNNSLQGKFGSNDHSSMMVPVMAYGPGAQAFLGFYKNTEIFHRVMKLLKNANL